MRTRSIESPQRSPSSQNDTEDKSLEMAVRRVFGGGADGKIPVGMSGSSAGGGMVGCGVGLCWEMYWPVELVSINMH